MNPTIKFKDREWAETKEGGLLQQTVEVLVDGFPYGKFLIRRYGDYKWSAIALNVPRFGAGQIIAEGQSDMDARKKAEEEVIKAIKKYLSE